MKMNKRRALLASFLLLALATVAAGCGGDDEQTASSSQAGGNATDAAFVADMTAHHHGAIEMARVAQERAERPEIRQLAKDIIAAQESEIATMKDIDADFAREGASEGDGGMGMSDSEMGMEMDSAELEQAEPFDRAFIDAMVPHHEGAVAMAKEELAKGENPELRKMAQDIIDAQTREIAQMKEWRKAWYGSTASSDSGDHDSMDMDG